MCIAMNFIYEIRGVLDCFIAVAQLAILGTNTKLELNNTRCKGECALVRVFIHLN